MDEIQSDSQLFQDQSEYLELTLDLDIGGGFLTERDRKYIYGERPDRKNAEHQIRYRIRDRTRSALEDFTHIHYYMNSPDDYQVGDIDSVFEPVKVENSEDMNAKSVRTHMHMKDVLKVLILGLGIDRFPDVVLEAFSEVAAGQLFDPEGPPEFDAWFGFEWDKNKKIDLSNLKAKFDNGETLSHYEFTLLRYWLEN